MIKRLSVVAIASAVLSLFSLFSSPREVQALGCVGVDEFPTYTYDVNEDGKISSIDQGCLVAYYGHVYGSQQPPLGCVDYYGDVVFPYDFNRDGKVTSVDMSCQAQKFGFAYNSIAQMLADSVDPHDGCFNQISPILSYDWVFAARPNLGQNPPNGPDGSALTVWAGIAYDHSLNGATGSQCTQQGNYASSVANPANVRVQMRRLEVWVLTESSGWQRLDSYGGWGDRRVTFQGSCVGASTVRDESEGVSWRLLDDNTCIVHPWGGWPRASIPSDVVCVWSHGDFRLIKDDPNGVDNLDQAHFFANVGADIYQNTTDTNPPVDWGVGTMRKITRQWRTINMTSCSSQTLNSNYPEF